MIESSGSRKAESATSKPAEFWGFKYLGSIEPGKAASFLLLAGVELIYLKDHLDGGGAWRMNTLFKFYLQVLAVDASGASAVFSGSRSPAVPVTVIVKEPLIGGSAW